MKKIIRHCSLQVFFYGLIVSLGFSSCDKVKNPYIKGNTGTIDTTGTKVRKLLLEEFTGHKCGACPPGAQTIQQLKTQYPDKIISIAIHAGFFASVSSPLYTNDFHSNEGDDYNNDFGVSSNPVGMVNRKDYPINDQLKDVGEWGSLAGSILSVSPDADIKITNSYNSSSRQLTAVVHSEFLNPLNGTYKLVVLLTEDSIISPQKDYALPSPSNDTNYVHRHMLRDGITSSYGDVLISGVVSAGDTAVKTYSYPLPVNFNNTTPNPDHCYVTAYIYDAATYEVIQAEEKKIK